MRYDKNQKKLHQVKLICKNIIFYYIYTRIYYVFLIFYILVCKCLIGKCLYKKGEVKDGRGKSFAACRVEGVGGDLSISFEIGC